MMNGPEKSDSAIVATKLANNAQPPTEQSAGEIYAAEPVERRAGTKGNAGQQSTRRTQSRESVSQALERIRKVARERKKEKFTALLHHINIDPLEEAFYELKANAAPGVDRLTWKDYEADLEHNLEDLHGRVIPDQAEDPKGPHAGEAAGDQGSTATVHAPAAGHRPPFEPYFEALAILCPRWPVS
jgi:RNA-directed DNA polymerase